AVDPVKTIDPNRRFANEVLQFFLVVLILGGLLLDLSNAVGVVRLIVHDEDVLLPSDLAPEHPIDQARVALDVAGAPDFHPNEVALLVALLVEDFVEACGKLAVEIRWRRVAVAPSRGRLRADVNDLAAHDRAPR